jgi:adenosylhomocysteinase
LYFRAFLLPAWHLWPFGPNQFLALVRLAREGKSYKSGVYDVPAEQDQDLARLKLETMGIRIDTLSDEQKRYATDYLAGT